MNFRIRFSSKDAGLLAPAAALFIALAVRPAIAPDQMLRSAAKEAGHADHASVINYYRRLPLSFEANRGQFDKKVKFLSRGAGYSLFLTPTEAVLALKPQSKDARTDGETIRMRLVGANPSPNITGLGELPGKNNYLIGNDPAKWRTDIPIFAKVKMADVYPGIDLIYYGNQRQIEYDWIVAPGADVNAINFAIKSDGKPAIDSQGNLVLDKNKVLFMHKPFVYQDRNGVRTQIAAGYEIKSQGQIGFHVGGYDASFPLVIDPAIVYSTYLGGNSMDTGYGIAVDSMGAIYIAGGTQSTNFPTASPLQAANNSYTDAFVAKLNASGDALVYSTYLGGSGVEAANGIAVDSSGAAYVIGGTWSTDFPTVKPYQAAFGGGFGDAFIAKLNASGNVLVYSTYLGGGNTDHGRGIAVDSAGAAYVTGMTSSVNFPTANPFQAAYGGGNGDVFITKLSPSGGALVYSTFLGGGFFEEGSGIALDSSGAAYVTGQTSSANFPLALPFQASNHNGAVAFVTKINASGNALVYSTFLGGGNGEYGYSIAVDSSGAAYVAGETYSTNFPTASPVQSSFGGDSDAFVTKLNASGDALVYSTYLGGGGQDKAYGIAVDSSGAAYVAGETLSANFPTASPVQNAYGGGCDAFFTKLNASGNTIVCSTYLGGSNSEYGYSIAVDSSGVAYVAGETSSKNFPMADPFQAVEDGFSDAFVVKIGDVQPPLLAISLTKSNYINGDNVAASVFKLKNYGPSIPGELKVWFSIPGIYPISAINLGSNGSFILPAGFYHDFGTIVLFPVTSAYPRGNYEFNSRIINPATGAILSEDLNSFIIQ